MLSLAFAAVIAASCSGAGSSASPSNGQANPTLGSATPSGIAASGSAARPSASGKPAASGSPALPSGGSGSPASSASAGSPSPAASASDCLSGLTLTHVDQALEDKLPCRLGGISLERFSVSLAGYIASSTGGERDLYPPWLVQFGLTPSDVNIAIVADLTQQENVVIHAINVPKGTDAELVNAFSDQARKAGWPVNSRTVAGRAVMGIQDPAAKAAGSLSIGYILASQHVFYTIITDDPNLLVEALIKLH